MDTPNRKKFQLFRQVMAHLGLAITDAFFSSAGITQLPAFDQP